MITKDSNFHKLHETDRFILAYVFEAAYLIDKKSEKEMYLGDFYGDPTCGLISEDNNWCIVGGATLSIWKVEGNVLTIKDDNLYWACKIRQTAPYEVQLLIDASWSDKGSVWSFNINTSERHKLKDLIIDDGNLSEVSW
jgi:hypothetical protein